jgi:hypothetical protein
MTNLLALAVFGGFVLLVLLAGRFSGSRTMVNTLIAYVVCVTLGVGATRIDLWPFSAWPLIALYHPPTATHARLVAVDEAGVEQMIDARAFGSLSFLEVLAWMDGNLEKLAPADRDAACAYLLASIESARGAAVAKSSMGWKGRPLGPATAPYFILTPRWWDGAGLPQHRLVGLRFYRVTWDLEQRQRDPEAFTRKLIYEYREPR